MDWPSIVTALVAVYGAIASTYSLLIRHMEKATRIRVDIKLGFVSFPSGHTSEPMLFLSAANSGGKRVTLASQGFLLPQKRGRLISANPFRSVDFPHELAPGKSCEIWLAARGIAEQLRANGFSGSVKLVGFYRDQVGNEYTSKPYKFETDRWLEVK